MNIETAFSNLCDYYAIAKNNNWISDKVAWALYQTWRDADKETYEKEQRQFQMFTFGERVANLLQEQNITQREFADKCNITEVSMSRYIRGNRIPKAPLIATMAKHLGVSADYLLGIKDEMEKVKCEED